MTKNSFKTIKLEKGEMHVYDLGAIKLHAYKTEDFMSDEVFILEKNGNFVIIESPCFFDNITALEKYLQGKNIAGMLIAYHAAGGTFLPSVPKYSTRIAKRYGEEGGGKALIDSFVVTFGALFDSKIHKIENILNAEEVNIGGINFVITPTNEAYDILIPEINAVYTHMLGHDCHSIVAGAAHADAIKAQLKDFIANGYALILTSHYTPEDLKDAQTKINYLEKLKSVAANCNDAEQFKKEIKSLYPDYGGENYLDMTANMFFA